MRARLRLKPQQMQRCGQVSSRMLRQRFGSVPVQSTSGLLVNMATAAPPAAGQLGMAGRVTGCRSRPFTFGWRQTLRAYRSTGTGWRSTRSCSVEHLSHDVARQCDQRHHYRAKRGRAPFISVVIATGNRQALLAETLDALAAQQWPTRRGGSSSRTMGRPTRPGRWSTAAARGQGLPVQYLYVAEPGKSAAVNTALQQAQGDLIAFTDDDTLPEPLWLAQLAAAFDDPAIDFVAGRILPRWEAPAPPWMSPSLYGVLAIADGGESPLRIQAGGHEHPMTVGANMAVRMSVIRYLGGLRCDLGKLEGTLRTGEDHEFFLRMIHGGCVGVYVPSAIVRHFVPRARLRREYFRAWLYQNGQDVARLEARIRPDAVSLVCPAISGALRRRCRCRRPGNVRNQRRGPVRGDGPADLAGRLPARRMVRRHPRPHSSRDARAEGYDRSVALRRNSSSGTPEQEQAHEGDFVTVLICTLQPRASFARRCLADAAPAARLRRRDRRGRQQLD